MIIGNYGRLSTCIHDYKKLWNIYMIIIDCVSPLATIRKLQSYLSFNSLKSIIIIHKGIQTD